MTKKKNGQITGADIQFCVCYGTQLWLALSIQSIHFPERIKVVAFLLLYFVWETKVSSISFENNNGIYLYAAAAVY